MNCKRITVFSNKGGVGKTFVTVNLATSLAVARHKVLIVDFDLQAGLDMARMMKLSPKASLVDIISEIQKTEDPQIITKFTTKHSSGLEFLPAVSHTGQLGQLTSDNIKPFLKKASQVYEYIFFDGGRSFSDQLVTVLDYSNLILLVATPDILAVYQIKWCLEVLQNLQFPSNMIKLILNRSESRGSVAWQEVRSALTCEIFGHIPSEGRTVGLALNRGVPCVIDSPRSKVAEAFIKMASQLRRDDVYVKASEGAKDRTLDGSSKPGEFWEQFGISQQMGQGSLEGLSSENEIIAIKKKIHERLVERLNLEGITTEVLSDPNSIIQVKKTAEGVVANLLVEESGGKIESHEERVLIVRDIVNEALGLGPLEDFLADPDVTDIMVNGTRQLYVEKGGKLILTNKQFVSESKMRSIIDRIIAPLGRRIDESTPMVDARLPDGSRINAIIPPLSLTGPMITIRKFGSERITINDMLEKYQSLSPEMAKFLKACVLGRKNIIVSGGTGAGKTTLLNVVSEFVPDSERIVTIEDAAELKLKKSHVGR
ncbi:MAG: Flp pilus assembly complex ATPase component TadA, partial [Candidatus Omnitrophica bacterium]|nr:Flp pilus assembly complex ATPase component TadA [Candidatus Omnitrophota bacterium]